jgi:hypothetical protein
MGFPQYTVDSAGNVHLSDDLNAWMLLSSWRRHGLYHRICQQEYRSQHGQAPEWAKLGEMFPPDDSLY